MDAEAVVGWVALAVGIACGASGLYMANVYRQRYEDGRLLRRIIVRNIRVSIAATAVAVLVAYSYLNDPLPRPWGAVVLGVALVAMMWGPISDAVLIWRERRTR